VADREGERVRPQVGPRAAGSTGVALPPRAGDAFAPGSVVAGGFRIERRIGEGGIAEVLAAAGADGREVALKVLHPHLARDPVLRERFRKEMELTRRLLGPGIVRVFELYDHAGRPFFAMERLRGMTLARRLRTGPLPADEARRIAREICLGLQEPHGKGTVHRDLKPHNVFLTADGVKLLDFGLSKSVGDAQLTASSRVLGTPGYIAPEVWEGDPADARADLYAVGAMLFEMIAGERAFPGTDPFLVASLQREPPDLRDVQRAASEGDARIVARALAPDPEERFLTAAQMSRALQGASVFPAPPATPRLAAGAHDVVVHQVVDLLAPFKRRTGIPFLLNRLGGHATRRWKWQLAAAGEAALLTGASRACAEAVLALCAEHGVPATVRRARDRSRAEAWLARRGAALLVICAAFAALAVLALFGSSVPGTLAGAAIAALVGYVLSWGFRPRLGLAPLRDVPTRQSPADRFAAGMARRAELLQRAAARLPRDARAPLLTAARAAAGAARHSDDGSLRTGQLEAAAQLDELLGAMRCGP
jgi:hypothetical protein